MKVVSTQLEHCDMKVETHEQKDSFLYPDMPLPWQMFKVFMCSNVQSFKQWALKMEPHDPSQ